MQKRSGDRHKRPWIVRWSLTGRQRSRAFRTKAEADRFRSGLLLAQQRGEMFDLTTGEPESWLSLPNEIRIHDWARRWVAEQWSEWAPRTRASAVEALTRLVPLLVAPTAPPPPAGLRRHLAAWLRPAGGAGSEEALAWLDRWALQFGQLNKALLAEVDQALGIGDDGGRCPRRQPAVSGRSLALVFAGR